MNLLKALVLYVEQGSPLQRKKPQKTRMKTFRFNQKQRKICWGKKNLETIAHTISVFRKDQ